MTNSGSNNISGSGFNRENRLSTLRQMIKYLLFSLALLSQTGPAQSQDLSLYQKKIFSSGGRSMPYRILYPAGYDSTRIYPLVIFLHGSGQLGTDNERQLLHGAGLFLNDSSRRQFPAIVVFPQCGPFSSWTNFKISFDTAAHKMNMSFGFQKQGLYSSLVKQLADSLSASGKIDTSRRYIGGLSLGGFATFDFIERYPGYFAAAFPICGGGDTSFASRISGRTSVWIFHGGEDPLVSVTHSRDFYHALKDAGGDVRYTEYPTAKHNSWDSAFKEPGLLSWIFSKKAETRVTGRSAARDTPVSGTGCTFAYGLYSTRPASFPAPAGPF